jgi:hypothetical protein
LKPVKDGLIGLAAIVLLLRRLASWIVLGVIGLVCLASGVASMLDGFTFVSNTKTPEPDHSTPVPAPTKRPTQSSVDIGDVVETMYVSSATLDVHEWRNASSDVIGVLVGCEEIAITNNKGLFIEILYGGSVGYVNRLYVTDKDNDCDNTPMGSPYPNSFGTASAIRRATVQACEADPNCKMVTPTSP